MRIKVFLVFIGIWLASCASYYTKNLTFNKQFESRDFEGAETTLASDKKAEGRKTKLLYFLNQGTVLYHLGKHEESNEFFEKAYLFIEDYEKNYGLKAASFLLNPSVIYYQGEEHERLFINYYKALNYLAMGNNDDALVEVRRMTLRLNQLQDRVKAEGKYDRDAFIHLLMGIVYDVSKEYNNAFIAYRNAYEIYKSDYSEQFKLGVPDQLKKDLLRTSAQMGMYDELDRFEKEFGLKYEKDTAKSHACFLWHNGLGPHKEEWSITFTVAQGGGGNVTFSNAEHGFSFTYPRSAYSSSGADFSDIQVIRIVLPKYVERKTLFNSGAVSVGSDGKIQRLDLVENLNAVAFKVLQDRMLKELAEELIRVAVKQAIAEAARKENGNAGAALSIFNAITQKADTRNWQTLPHSIYYKRIGLTPGSQELVLHQYITKDQEMTSTISVDIPENSAKVVTFYSLNSK